MTEGALVIPLRGPTLVCPVVPAGNASNAVRLSSASMAGRNVFNGLTTIQQSLTDAFRERSAHA